MHSRRNIARRVARKFIVLLRPENPPVGQVRPAVVVDRNLVGKATVQAGPQNW